MGQALYRKYRSRSFDEVVGQDHIVKTLSNAIKAGRISHAYLFTGPRGVGKTSVARILAHAVNDLPYTDESMHIDIIEIDGASNRRIDEIRELRERARVAPAAAKYKVYIIDEVHMLTREAFNALLKTLEEPPAHCIFILATTEAHKLPETITSRTQRFEFRPVGPAQSAAHLNAIAKQEGIAIDDEALQLLADFGDGSFRDSINYLDQLRAGDQKITAQDVRDLLGLPAAARVKSLVKNLSSGDSQAVLEVLNSLAEKGINPVFTAAALAKELRQKLLSEPAAEWIVQLLKQLIEIPASHRPGDSLELSLLAACASQAGSTKPSSPGNSSRSVGKEPEKVPKVKAAPSDKLSSDFSLSRWDDVLDAAKQRSASLYTALRLARPNYADGALVLAFQYPLHQKKFNLAKNKAVLSEIIENLFGVKLPIECIVDEAAVAPAEDSLPAGPAPANPLNAINNIFGPAEMLEN